MLTGWAAIAMAYLHALSFFSPVDASTGYLTRLLTVSDVDSVDHLVLLLCCYEDENKRNQMPTPFH
jgi:hypothetical protein